MTSEVVSAFPLPPPGWRELQSSDTGYTAPDIPDGPVTIFGISHNTHYEGDKSDTELKDELLLTFEGIVEDYKRVMAGLPDIDNGLVDKLEDQWEKCIHLSNQLGQMHFIDSLPSHLLC